MVRGDRAESLRQFKLSALVRDHWPSPPGEGLARRAGPLPGGATLLDDADVPGRGWVLIDDPDVGSLGAALAWAWRYSVTDLDVLVEGAAQASVVARRAGQFAAPPAVWSVSGRSLSLAVLRETTAGPPLDPGAAGFIALLEAHGVDPVVEHGLLTGEVLGLEVARVESTEDGYKLAVGVGAHDRDARRDFRPGQDLGDALDEVASVVRSRRTAEAGRHPANTLARERWLRAVVVARPSLVGAAWLQAVASPTRRRDLRQGAPAGAVGEDREGRPVVVVCSTGVDVDVVPTAADIRVLAGHPTAPLALVLPEGDDYPVTRQLAAALLRPATVVTVPRHWPALLGPPTD